MFSGYMLSDERGSGSVMKNVSKAKFDGSLLEFALLKRAEYMTIVWLSMGTLRAYLVCLFPSEFSLVYAILCVAKFVSR